MEFTCHFFHITTTKGNKQNVNELYISSKVKINQYLDTKKLPAAHQQKLQKKRNISCHYRGWGDHFNAL